MRPINRSLLLLLSAALISATASGGYAILEAQNEYYGVCSKLSGFPGLLQHAGLLQAGTCKSLPGGSVCAAGTACTVNSKAGRCKNTAKPGGSPICSCVAAISQ